MQIWILIVDSFRESLDRKIFWVLAAMSMFALASMASVGFEPGAIDLVFGLWRIESEGIQLFDPTKPTYRPMIAYVAVSCADLLLGSIGIILMIIATADFFPSFMDRGAIDALLSKPISRAKLFLGKYLGSMVFVLLQALLFVVLSFLIMGLRWHVWLPKYLLTIPLLVVLFSYLYCISALAAVATRSSIASIFLTFFSWFVFSGVRELNDAMDMYPAWREQRMVYYTARALGSVLPKTQDVRYLADRWTGAGFASDLARLAPGPDPQMLDELRELEQEARGISAIQSLGTSLAFEAVVLMLAIWRFSRKDF